jgi:hypothetical protein
MPSEHTAAVCLFWAQIVSGIAAMIYVATWLLPHWGRIREADLTTFPMRHPRVLLGMLILSIAAGIAGLWFASHVPKPQAAKPCPVCPTSVATSITTPVPSPQPSISRERKRLTGGDLKGPTDNSAVVQKGNGNQQTTVQAPIVQDNSGGCNQQVVGGNNNTNNCGPPERHLTKEQKDGLIALAAEIPKTCLVFFGSGDTAEPEAYAKEMHDLWASVGSTRDPGYLFGWHSKGIYFQVKSLDEPCAQFEPKLVSVMKDLGFAVAGTQVNPGLGSDSELQVLVGDP